MSIDEVFSEDDGDIFGPEDGRLEHWWREIEGIVSGSDEIHDLRSIRREPLEPSCAWYCPIHFFGHSVRRAFHCAISLFHLSDWVYVAHKAHIDANLRSLPLCL
jgi:hypothetical protein